jgi:hypothetical protein
MIGSNLAFALPNSRMQESEADKLGLIFAAMPVNRTKIS